ncbi:uncharacterized protein LOC114268567 [Camellia sinensis]|uniref:uncharacterized protein LOC114268567 n=1 Tax=Camellia sinensis TaxID=4442 RepID=UPI00103568EA|nr:uncharacterized protein LOC114268567 [Camellia sinensis]
MQTHEIKDEDEDDEEQTNPKSFMPLYSFIRSIILTKISSTKIKINPTKPAIDQSISVTIWASLTSWCSTILPGHALSLLSTKRNSWLSASDFSSQCSAALHELIAENRTAMNGTQPASSSLDHHQICSLNRMVEVGGHLTLDLMQALSSAFGFLSREKSKEEEECYDD